MQKKRQNDSRSQRSLVGDSVRNLKAIKNEFDNDSDTSIGSCVDSTGKASYYGYEDAAPDADNYGYGDAAPSRRRSSRRGSCGSQGSYTKPLTGEGGITKRVSRRSSMPTESNTALRHRRSCMEQMPFMTSCRNLGEGEQVPRRSSLKSGSGRRSSIGYSGEDEVALRDGQRVRRRTSICFDAVVDEHVVPDVAQYAKKDDLWFQDEDYDRIHDKNIELLHKASFDCPAAGKKYCVRGLESLMAPDQVDIRKQSARHAVLSEQYFQEQENQYSDDQIATLYRSSARDSCSEAAERAAQDAKEVESYLRDTRRQHRRSSM